MKEFKAMLAKDADFIKLRFPLLASPKLDGVRATVVKGILMLNTGTGKVTSVSDYMADGLEMVPGVKVDREMLGLNQAERKKLIKQRKEIK